MQTNQLEQRVRQRATVLKDSMLLSKLLQGDLISQDAVYHRFFLNKLKRKANRKTQGRDYSVDGAQLHGIAFADIVAELE